MKRDVFIETENVSRFAAALTLAEDTDFGRPGMMMVSGEAGRGKTVAARSSHAVRGGIYLRAWQDWTQAAFLQALCFEVCGARPHGSNRCKVRIVEELEHERRTIYMDEADRLDIGRLEDLRDIHDETGAPIVLIGEQGLPARVAARSRIDDRIPGEYRIPFAPVSQQDITLYALEAANLVLEPKACKIVHTFCKGNFRRAHNAIVSLDQMAKAVQTDQVDAAMAKKLRGLK